MRKLFALTACALPLFLWSCGGNQEKSQQTETTASTESVSSDNGSSATENSNTVVITSNDQMRFDLDQIKVKAGQQVTLTLKNVGVLSKEAMGHNWVLLKPGTDVAAFAMEAMSNKKNEFIPASSGAIVAHTKLLGPDESDTITFTVEKGEYEFICSFPGHYGIMRGTLIAE
ncbi:azurin [Arcticibacter pallidicorallinus]|uniref:Azurin n=1 Tax=Arcticibacter pallidicorallinus TaxID=1259464 RepID=A0A2T0U532_9SPHI|nr:azurin [Arcticibacter pallidicorallinus]PRY53002.1 azurin [Arcticibacter pallidicorallinus]